MSIMNPLTMIFIGFVLVLLAGIVIPFLMVMHLVETTYFLSFLSFGVSVGGLFMGIIGAAQYVHTKRKDD
jgi:hypothetical protein